MHNTTTRVSFDSFHGGETHVYLDGSFAGRIYHGCGRRHVTAELGEPDVWGGPIINGRIRDFGQPEGGGYNLLAEAQAWCEEQLQVAP